MDLWLDGKTNILLIICSRSRTCGWTENDHFDYLQPFRDMWLGELNVFTYSVKTGWPDSII